MARMTAGWVEVGERVFVRRYAFYDQNIVVVLGRDEALVLDTRSTHGQAREILDDLRVLGSPAVGIVVNSHGHYDHAFGNAVFRPAPIWGHERCGAMLRRLGDRMREVAAAEVPDIRDDLAEVVVDPPDRTFSEQATICLDDGREVSLRHLGRGHTDNDVVMRVEGADVLCAGDLLENGATPYFGDGYPMDWPATAEAVLAMTGPSTVVVPGHGDHAGLAFVESQVAGFHAVAAAARQVHAGEATIDDVLPLVPYPPADGRQPLERAVAQLRGELDVAPAGA
jgi:glyoxylase-like metal-dependent hydrolase (beta-lactamase superfamily II)